MDIDSRVQTSFEGLQGKEVAFCRTDGGNLSLIRTFLEHGTEVQARDRRQRGQLDDTAGQPEELGAEPCLGEDYLENLDADMIFRMPRMKFFLPELDQARKEGRAVASEMEVFFNLCPCRIYAVTGSDRKTTTTTTISKLLGPTGKAVHLDGNIGKPLLPEIASIGPDDVTVAELPSFQLISMRKSPDVTVVTNVPPNHLGIHKGMTEYVEARKNVVRHRNTFSHAVINADNATATSFTESVRGQVRLFSRRRVSTYGTWLWEDGVVLVDDTEIIPASDIRFLGMHNVENYLVAISAVRGEVDTESIRKVAKEFSSVQHHMGLVRELGEVKYYNDSVGASPTRTISGTLSAYPDRTILLAGDYDKHLLFEEPGKTIVEKVKLLILMGQAADKIEENVKVAPGYQSGHPEILRVSGMEETVPAAYGATKSDDTVSLSPACASFDQYTSFEVRGYHSKQLVNALPGTKKKEE